MYDDKIWVFDDIVDKETQDKIENCLLANNFPWYYIADITDPSKMHQKRPGHQHYFVIKNEIVSDFHNELLPVIDASCKKIGFEYKKIVQGRAFLQLPLKGVTSKDEPDTPHIDLKYKHLVILYYVTTAEGDTVITNQKTYNGGHFSKRERVTPKKGRVVVFDGTYWHWAHQTDNSVRVVANYNVY